MISRQVASRFLKISRSSAVLVKTFASANVFPREREGNQYDVNFSLLEDGVTSTGDSFRNARVNLLTSRLSVKPSNGAVAVKSPKLTGSFKLNEAGDSITHDDFASLKAAQEEALSSGADLFVEDAALGSSALSRVGARVVTQNAATALLFRKLMVPFTGRDFHHAARFNGWQNDERWRVATPVWDASTSSYTVLDRPSASKGQRPVAAFIGGDNDTLAIQFVERGGTIVGGDVVAGDRVPIRGVIEGMSLAAAVVVNAQQADHVAVPSCATFAGKSGTVAVVNAPDDVLSTIAKTNGIHGAYGSVFSADGVSAMWNGTIIPSGSAAGVAADAATAWSGDVPSVSDGEAIVAAVEPANLIAPATTIFFFDASVGKKSQLTEEETTKRILAAIDNNEAKVDAIKTIFKNTKAFVVANAGDIVV